MSADACASSEVLSWSRANRRLIAKALGELIFEEALQAEADGAEHLLVRLSPALHYRFRARRGIWGFLQVAPDSVYRCCGADCAAAEDAAQFFIDAAPTLGMHEITLGQFLHELANTLAADVKVMERRAHWSADRMISLPDTTLQALLDGHPKALLNKGRIGWGAAEFAAYGTEAAVPVRLHWLAVPRSAVRSDFATDVSPLRLLADAMEPAELRRFQCVWEQHRLDADWLPLPVHPWQWQQYVQHAFAAQLARGSMLPLGVFGDGYLPQQSLRTLSHATRPEALHIKLPLTVLNTSCYRGIPGRYIEAGAALSSWLGACCANDPVLAQRGTRVLREVAGIFHPHPHHEQIAGTPYRYRELLGAIWRESPAAQLDAGERPLLFAALLQRDEQGHSLIAALIDRSGLPIRDWLQRLFDAVVVPLYHLICRYGVGLVAHAQNLCLILQGDVPARVALKDLQGDLRLIDRDFPELSTLPPQVRAVLPRLPPAHLLHDLVTGHFVSVLRFVSMTLSEDRGYPESDFYAVLAQVLRAYQAQHPELKDRFQLFDLFRATIERVCINRVRFAAGYADTAERLQAALGSPLRNPLAVA